MVASKRVIKWLLGAAVVGAAFALWWSGGWQPLWELFSDRERLRSVVEGSGPLAPMVYLLMLLVQAIVLPLPAPPVAVAGGYAFGTLFGFVLSWVGVLLGARHLSGSRACWDAGSSLAANASPLSAAGWKSMERWWSSCSDSFPPGLLRRGKLPCRP